MRNALSPARFLRNPVLVIFIVTVLAALIIDLLGDRSFGALMLSALPIAALALGCLLVGPWLAPERRTTAFRNWLIAGALILGVTLIYSSGGAVQAKEGELVFTYAALTFAFPASLVLPFVLIWAGPLIPNSALIREVITILVCMVAGSAEWWLLSMLREKVAKRNRESSAQA